MRPARQDPRLWGLGATAAVHALLWLALVHEPVQTSAASAGKAPALAVILSAARPTAPAGPSEPAAAESAPQPPALPVVPLREDLYYYFPQELERQLIVLRDHTGEADIVLRQQVVMHLFVNVDGKVGAISFEEPAPSARLQEQLRTVFMQMEFLPGMKDGMAVPSRIKIAIAATVPAGGDEVPD